jgi:anti-sigma regulatory factor (Ser/Thr protein kinase)
MRRTPLNEAFAQNVLVRRPLLRRTLVVLLLGAAFWLRTQSPPTDLLLTLRAWQWPLICGLMLPALPLLAACTERSQRVYALTAVGLTLAFHGSWTIYCTLMGVPNDGVPLWQLALRTLLSLGIIIGMLIAWENYQRRRMLAEQVVEAQGKLTRAELASLQSQLSPHMLANALTSASILLKEGRNHEAARLIVDTEQFLRSVLREADLSEVQLSTERLLLDQYLSIQQVRFERELEVRWNVPAELETARLPRLILQPLAENALIHGFRNLRRQNPCLAITARRDGTNLVVEMTDNGVGMADPSRPLSGRGLSNIRERLQRHYRTAAELTLRSSSSGTTATLRVPLATTDRQSMSERST